MHTPYIPPVVEDAATELTATACPVCGGDGFLVNDDDTESQCEACAGTGQVQPEETASEAARASQLPASADRSGVVKETTRTMSSDEGRRAPEAAVSE
jgi:DnaJ-class molecular chaperone